MPDPLRGVVVFACPDCGTDLDDGPYEAWCPACEREWSYARLLADVPGCQHPED